MDKKPPPRDPPRRKRPAPGPKRDRTGGSPGEPSAESGSGGRKPGLAIIGICIFLLNSFGELLFRKATGLEYSEAVLKVFWENGPLSIAIAFISWRCYRLGAGEWSGLTEFLACGAALCAAGLATQWTTHVPVFSDAWHRGAGYAWLGRWDFISRIAATVVYTLRGYLDLYGLPRFFLIAFTAATAPWIVMRMYGKAMAKADAAGGAD